MKELWRRFRGAVGMGLTWAVGWAPIGAVLGTALHFILPGGPLGLGGVMILNATALAGLGFVGGTLFSGVLRLTEGRHRFDELSLPRFALWGAVGGGLLGAVAAWLGMWGSGLGLLGLGMIGATTILSAVSATGTLALARAAGDEQLTGGVEDIDGVGLTSAEVQALLGSGD